jgi:pyruvate ferredoxin oxidoreductase alpha subunit
VLSTDVAMATHDTGCTLRTIVCGLGGRPITRRSLEEAFAAAAQDELDSLTFLDLDHEIVERERTRMTTTRRSGPSAENILRDIGTVASRMD